MQKNKSIFMCKILSSNFRISMDLKSAPLDAQKSNQSKIKIPCFYIRPKLN